MVFLAWIKAFRLRTLPLAISCAVMGSSLALGQDSFSLNVFILCLTTTLFLQILSNLANDLGDFEHGVDDDNRAGPERAMQSGLITKKQMKIAIISLIILSLTSGVILLIIGLSELPIYLPLVFFVLGITAIIAAIKYTYGKNPYGYAGWGDFFVFFFFGIIGVIGTYYLHTNTFTWIVLLPASALGALATGVLNLNNIRDIQNDSEKGKKTLAVKLGKRKAKFYHNTLILYALIGFLVYLIFKGSLYQLSIVVLSYPFFVYHLIKFNRIKKQCNFDKELKNLALSTFTFAIIFGLSQL